MTQPLRASGLCPLEEHYMVSRWTSTTLDQREVAGQVIYTPYTRSAIALGDWVSIVASTKKNVALGALFW